MVFTENETGEILKLWVVEQLLGNEEARIPVGEVPASIVEGLCRVENPYSLGNLRVWVTNWEVVIRREPD